MSSLLCFDSNNFGLLTSFPSLVAFDPCWHTTLKSLLTLKQPVASHFPLSDVRSPFRRQDTHVAATQLSGFQPVSEECLSACVCLHVPTYGLLQKPQCIHLLHNLYISTAKWKGKFRQIDSSKHICLYLILAKSSNFSNNVCTHTALKCLIQTWVSNFRCWHFTHQFKRMNLKKVQVTGHFKAALSNFLTWKYYFHVNIYVYIIVMGIWYKNGMAAT